MVYLPLARRASNSSCGTSSTEKKREQSFCQAPLICSTVSVRPEPWGSRMVTPLKSELAMPCRACMYSAFASGMVGSRSPAASR